MSRAQPSPAEERWLTLALRHRQLRLAAENAGRTGGWKTSTWLSRCLFFALGLFAAGLAGGSIVWLPAPLFCGGIGLIVAAELLIAKRRVVRSGIEEALFACGCVAIAIQVSMWSGHGDALAALLIAVSLGIAGGRLLNPLFTSLALLVLSLAVATAGTSLSHWEAQAARGAVFCALAAALALGAGAREFARPSHDHMIDGALVSMAVAASVWLLAGEAQMAFLVPLTFAVVCAFIGVRRRSHATLFAALLQLPCLAWALHDLLPLTRSWQLLCWGALLVLAGVGVERALRRPRHGLVSQAVDEGTALDLLQTLGAVAIAPGNTGANPATHGHGGGFGGGGASGQY
jgi:hypothetical protein